MTQNVSRTWSITSGDYVRTIESFDQALGRQIAKREFARKLFFTLLSGAAFGLVVFGITFFAKF